MVSNLFNFQLFISINTSLIRYQIFSRAIRVFP
nr:MAG TPA: hypothetical protein [Caudoviricetes sp.]